MAYSVSHVPHTAARLGCAGLIEAVVSGLSRVLGSQ